jgi:hypothetical protein
VLGARRVAIVLLVVLLTVGDAALVHAALDRSHRSDPSGAAQSASTRSVVTFSTASPGASASASPSATSSPTEQPGATATSTPGERDRLFTASDSTTAWRAHGGCSGKPDLAKTTNGGSSWSSLTSPAPHLLRIEFTSATVGWAVGASASCGSPTYYGTGDGGTTWTAASTLGSVWFPLKTDIRTSTGSTTKPCNAHSTPVALSPVGDKTALVVCPTGVERTTNAGATWKAVGQIPAGTVAAAAAGQAGTAVLVLSGASHCGGLRVATSTNSGRTWHKGSCLTEAVAPASVALAAGNDGLLVSAGRAYSTTDGGLHWS